MSKIATLKENVLLSIIKYIYEKKGRVNNDPDLNTFYKNGISFPEFACLICNISEIPNVTNKAFFEKQKEKNNEKTIDYMCKISSTFNEKIRYIFFKKDNYSIIIELALMNIYFEKFTLPYIISRIKELFKTINFEIHKENEIYTGLCFIRLLYILSDHKIQLAEEFNYTTDIDEVLSPIFKKLGILFILDSESFEYHQRNCLILQYQIIFDKYQEKIESSIQKNDVIEKNENQKNSLFNDSEREEEEIFLRLVNIVGKDFGCKLYNFEDIIEEGFIPKYIMNIFHIDSIENVINIESKSMDIQIKNIEAVINFLRKNNPSINYHLFDFRTPSKRSISIRILLRCIFNIYFLKSSREEMIDRLDRLTEEFKIKDKYTYSNQRFKRIKILYECMKRLPNFIVNGKTSYYMELKNVNRFCLEHNIPYIMDLSDFRLGNSEFNDFNDYYLYQIQIFFNLIDNGRKSLHLIEKLKNAIYKINRIKVPKFSTISGVIKAKRMSIEEDDEKQDQQQIEEDDDEDEEEEEIVSIKINEHPSTYKDRLAKVQNINQNKNEKIDNQTQILSPQKFWNTEKLENNGQFLNGILLPIEQSNDKNNKSIEKWNDDISKIQKKMENKKSPSNDSSDSLSNQISFNIPHSKYQTKLYKIFYYNENKWFFDKNEFDQFSNDKKIAIENARTPFICYIDSNEEDLISINSNFINGIYPKFEQNQNEEQKLSQEKVKRDPNEIFVYALCDRPLSMLNYEVDFSNRNKSSIKPVFFLIHVPKEKECLPNIKSIIIQIYTFLALICDIRIVVLNKSFYEIQVQNMLNIFNIVDKNIKELIENNKKDEELKRDPWNFSPINGFIDEDIDFETNYAINYFDDILSKPILFYNEDNNNNNMIYKESKTIFLINDKMIKNVNDEIDNCINESELFTNIKNMFDEQIIMHFINIDNHITYKRFLDTFNTICLKYEFLRSDIINNFTCIDCVSNISNRYISIKENIDVQTSTIKLTIQDRLSLLELNDDLLHSLSVLQNEIIFFSPKFDLCFNKKCQEIIEEIKNAKIKIDCDTLKKELNQSALENLEYLNYQLHKQFYWELEQLEELKRAHLSFLDNEYFDIIKILSNESISGFLYEENIGVLNEQIEKDQKLIQEIFSPYVKKIQIKLSPKEEKFEDVKRKGTSYIMKETENIREIKVTLEMKDDLKTIIEQDF